MTSPIRLCAVDIGSNAIKTRIVEAEEGARRTLSETRYPVRLGTSVFETQELSDEAVEATVSAFEEVAALIRAFDVDRTRIVATSAVRDARNGQDLIDAVLSATGLAIETISGIEEARLLAAGSRSDMVSGVRNLVIDVGGGSTELVYTRADLEVQSAHSLRLGAVRLARMIDGGGTSGADWEGEALVREEIARELERRPLPAAARDLHVVGVAGTMTALLGAIRGASGDGGSSFTAAELASLLDGIRGLEAEEIATRTGVALRRAQILLPGAMIVQALMALHSLDEISVSPLGLRDGLVEDMIDRCAGGRASDAHESVLRIGEKYQFDRAHSEQTARLAVSLFDQLQTLHGMPRKYRDLLRHAAMLHDIGQYIAYSGHHRHAWYLIMNEEIAGLSLPERRIVAAVARYHRKSLPDPSHPEFAALSEPERPAVERCAAILRLADALDAQHRQSVSRVKVSFPDGRIDVEVAACNPVLLELYAAARNASQFCRVFGKEVNVHAGQTGGGEDPDEAGQEQRSARC